MNDEEEQSPYELPETTNAEIVDKISAMARDTHSLWFGARITKRRP